MSATNNTQPVVQQFFQSPQDRVVSAFFLGALLLCSIFFFARAVLHALLGYRLRRNARAAAGESLADRLARLEANEELPRDALRDALARALGGRTGVVYDTQAYNIRVVLVIVFMGLASLSGLVQLVDFPAGMDAACAFFTAFGDICIEAAYVSALYEVSGELGALGLSGWEVIPFRVLVFVPLILSIASQGVATGIITTLPSPFSSGVALCSRQRFVPLAAAIVAINFAFSIYCCIRLYFTLVPSFLLLRHRLEAMLDIRFAWALSLVLLELFICVPSLTTTTLTAQDVPFSLGGILVLAAFTIRPEQEDHPSTGSVPGSDAPTAHSTGRNMETGSTGSRYPIDDYGRAGYEEYKWRWSRPDNGSKTAPMPKRSSLRQPGGREKRVSLQAPGEPPVPPMPVQVIQTAPLGTSQEQLSKETQPETTAPSVRATMPSRVPISMKSPDAAQRVRSKRYRDTPVVFPSGSSIQAAINAQAGPSVPRPLLLPSMREHVVGSSSSSRRSSPKGSPKRQAKPKLYVYIPIEGSDSVDIRPPMPRRTTNTSSVIAVDANHAPTPEADAAQEVALVQQALSQQDFDPPVLSPSPDKPSPRSSSRSSSAKRRHRRSSTALAIVTRTSSGTTQKRISIGNAGEVTIEIRQPTRERVGRTPRTTSLRNQDHDQPAAHDSHAEGSSSQREVGVTSPRPRGPRQLPGSARHPPPPSRAGQAPAPRLLGQLSFEGQPEGNWI